MEGTRTVHKTERWQLDKRVPVATIAAILIQTATVVWWAATTEGRVKSLEEKAVKSEALIERVIKVEVKMDGVQHTLTEIRDAVERKPR